ncbi:MAG: sulfatase-like hydrolase/transferase [Proteobacteria bacterium]|nr:sulfatase-like hydrolase/transferase [Pseudomonadota bacterium]
MTPPVVLITLDTTRADRLGSYGHAEASTPNLDALAERGTRFENAFAPVPLTIPSHSTIHTGLQPPRHGVRDNGDQRLSEAATTLAERFQAAGHETHASVGAFVTQAHWGFGQGFDRYDQDLGVSSESLGWHVERTAGEVVDDALIGLDGVGFLWVHVFDAHAPYRSHGTERDPYDAELTYLDAELGRLLKALPDDALVVVAGDHGESFGEGGEDAHGLLVTDGVLRIPLLVAGPDIPVGVESRAVSLADIAPTICRLRGLPAGEVDGVDLFADTDRIGVYSESRYGLHHFGWTPLERLSGPDWSITRGTRIETVGSPPEGAEAELAQIAALTGAFDLEATTLDLATVEQLQALGYLSDAVAPVIGGTDPRDGIELTRRMAHLRTLSPPQALDAMAELLAEEPGMRDLRMRRGVLLARMGRLDEAITELSDAQRASPSSTVAVSVGELWLQAGDPTEALSWFDEALTLDARSATAQAGRAQCLAQLGRLDEASAVLDDALLEHPDHGDLLMAGATLALATGALIEPWVEPVEAIARQRPNHSRVHHLLGVLYRATGQPELAEQALWTELRARPTNLAARLELAALFREQGRNVDLVKALRPLVTVQPDEPRWRAMTAQAYVDMGREDLAAEHIAVCAGHPGCPE